MNPQEFINDSISRSKKDLELIIKLCHTNKGFWNVFENNSERVEKLIAIFDKVEDVIVDGFAEIIKED
jgi:hypothetical protein